MNQPPEIFLNNGSNEKVFQIKVSWFEGVYNVITKIAFCPLGGQEGEIFL